jgi:hypothetical protein
MSAYKRKMLLGFLLSCLAILLGVVVVKYFPYPFWGGVLVMPGGFSAFYFLLYFFGEYEEDDASPVSMSQISGAHVTGMEITKDKK